MEVSMITFYYTVYINNFSNYYIEENITNNLHYLEGKSYNYGYPFIKYILLYYAECCFVLVNFLINSDVWQNLQ